MKLIWSAQKVQFKYWADIHSGVGRQAFTLLYMGVFPESYRFYRICDVFVELVFIWGNIWASTFHNEAVESHPNAPKDKTSIYVNTGIFPIWVGFV